MKLGDALEIAKEKYRERSSNHKTNPPKQPTRDDEKLREYRKRYYEKNKDKINETHRKYTEKHRERTIEIKLTSGNGLPYPMDPGNISGVKAVFT